MEALFWYAVGRNSENLNIIQTIQEMYTNSENFIKTSLQLFTILIIVIITVIVLLAMIYAIGSGILKLLQFIKDFFLKRK